MRGFWRYRARPEGWNSSPLGSNPSAATNFGQEERVKRKRVVLGEGRLEWATFTSDNSGINLVMHEFIGLPKGRYKLVLVPVIRRKR